METVQLSLCLPQLVRFKKVGKMSSECLEKTLSLEEENALKKTFSKLALKIKDEKMDLWV